MLEAALVASMGRDRGIHADLHTLGELKGSDFEVVDAKG